LPEGFTSDAVNLLEALTESWAGDLEFVEESEAQLAAAIRGDQTDRVRYAAPGRAPREILEAAHEVCVYVVSVRVSGEGRLEMLWYLREQSVSVDYHRYGNLGRRASEERAPVL